MSVRRHSSPTLQAPQPLLLLPPLLVRGRYECVSQRVPALQLTHSMLLCVAHAVVQVLLWPTVAREKTDGLAACSVKSAFDQRSRTDRMATAERISRASSEPIGQLLSLAGLSLARDDLTRLCAPLRSDNGGRKHEKW